MLGTTRPTRVLLVEDDIAVLTAYARVLSTSGYDVDGIEGGTEAVGRVAQRKYDVIVADIDLPGVTGVDLLRIVRGYDADVPVILITGVPDVETAVQAVEFGAFRYLIKPVESTALIETVGRAARVHALVRLKREALELMGAEGRELEDRDALQERFERALKSIWIAWQPIVSWSSRAPVAYEALLRTQEKSLANPLQFVAAAERLDRVHELGRCIRSRIAAEISKGPAGCDVFVNVHARDLADPELGDAASLLTGVSERVVLEVTERSRLDVVRDLPSRVISLRTVGFRMAIDDLGAGYAGLSSFSMLEPDIVKIDMALVRGVDRRQTQQRVIRSMLELCRQLGIGVVAEGVETVEERDTLVSLGCDLLQGYLFARPAADFPEPSPEACRP